MELIEYRNSILAEIKVNAAMEMTSDKEEFLNYFANILMDAEELNDFVPLPFEGVGKGRKRIQVDGYAYDELDNCLIIVACPFENSIDPISLTSQEADKIYSRSRAFIEESLSGYIQKNAEESAPGYGLAVDINLKYKNVSKYKFYIITDMVKSKLLTEIKSDTVAGKPAEYHIWDMERFHKLNESQSGKEDILIDLKKFTEHGIACLPASQTDEYTAYLCNMPGKILADLYNTYGGRLLEGNVRSFLTTRGKVNKGIRNTILNNPPMFFAFNNGIAATAYDVKIEKINNMPFITEINSLQIVNGGQTTASLAMAMIADKEKANNLKNVYVPMKLSVVSPDKAQELIPSISRYANSQNKVSDADFFSNHPFHVRMETFSRKLLAPAVNGNQYGTKWYYERANGQYRQEQTKLTMSEKKKFLLQNPKNQMVTKTEFAKYVNLYRILPHTVSLGAQKNFLKFAEWVDTEWKKCDVTFNEGFYRDIVAMMIIFKATDKIVKKQPWYESGYKANVVAYTISLLLHLVEKNYNDKAINLKAIWSKQTISSALENQLATLSEVIYYSLTDPARELQNVTEWAKKEACWKKASAIKIILGKDLEAELVDISNVQYEQKEEKKGQKLTNQINVEIEVAKFGVEKWKLLKKWGMENKVLNAIDINYLNSAIDMESGKFPSEKQCAKIMEVLNKARIESYPE